MKPATLQELEVVSQRWLESSRRGLTVQFWDDYEYDMAGFFDVMNELPHGEVMHQIMYLVAAVCHGTTSTLKSRVRALGPDAMEFAQRLLGHIAEFYAVLSAERAFRRGLLKSDWLIVADGGNAIVRTEFKDSGASNV